MSDEITLMLLQKLLGHIIQVNKSPNLTLIRFAVAAVFSYHRTSVRGHLRTRLLVDAYLLSRLWYRRSLTGPSTHPPATSRQLLSSRKSTTCKMNSWLVHWRIQWNFKALIHSWTRKGLVICFGFGCRLFCRCWIWVRIDKGAKVYTKNIVFLLFRSARSERSLCRI